MPLRLVELLPGTRQEDITCRMYETSLVECTGSYEALSYVWGNASEKTPIQINGQTLEIGPNLRLALFNLRELDKPRTLWIDAICIRQACTNERNQQVAIMGEIYRQARRTVVWLGDEVKVETKAAISMLEALAEDAISRFRGSHGDGNGEVENIVHLNNLPVSMIEKAGVKDPMFDRYQNDISAMRLLESEWWYRAWTLQEILLPSKAITVMGRYSIDWERLRIGANHGLNLGIWVPIAMGIMRDPILTPFMSLQAMGQQRQSQDPKEPPAQVLLKLLFQCRFREASIPHDKVYSLLGLVASNSSNTPVASTPAHPPLGIIPDYSSPVDTVYTHVARQMILESNTLDVLGGCGGSPATQALDSATMPSWVPDWRVAQHASPLVYDARDQRRTTHATAHSNALVQFIDTGGSTLVLHGHEIASLTALAPPLAHPIMDSVKMTGELEKWGNENHEIEGTVSLLRYLGTLLGHLCKSLGNMYEAAMSIVPLLTTFAKWESFATEVAPTNPGPGVAGSGSRPEPSPSNPTTELAHESSELGSSATPDEEPEDQLAVYWQTLCTGTYVAAANASGRGRKIASQKLFYSWRASLKPLYQLHRWNADRMLRPLGFVGYVVKTFRLFSEFTLFLEGSYGRRLGRAANGYLCLVPAAAEVGDKVILARGGRVPLVVREDRGTGYWRLVGEAYVHGIMDGEAWEDKCKEFHVR